MHILKISTAVFTFASPVAAQTVGDTYVGSGISTFGATLEAAYQIEPLARVRGIAMGGVRVDSSGEDDDGNTYSYDASIAAAAVLLDYFPQGQGWHISGGVLFDLSDITGVGTGPDREPFEINGETFENGRVDATVSPANSVAPMVAVGYEYDFGNQWVINGELGAIYTGGIEMDYTANSDRLQDAIDDDDDFQSAIAEGKDISVLPYIGLTVSYRF